MENFMPIFAAMSGTHVKTVERSSELAEFPCEVPSEKQLKDWLDLVGPKVKQSHGAILRNEVPASLVGLKAQAEEDLTGYTEIAALRLLGRAGERRDHRRGRQALQRVGMEGHHLRRRRVSMLAALNDLARRLAPHRLRASPPPPCTRPSRVCYSPL